MDEKPNEERHERNLTLSEEEHKERHILLHQHFDELIADWISQTNKLPSKATVRELMEWSHQQTIGPTEPKVW